LFKLSPAINAILIIKVNVSQRRRAVCGSFDCRIGVCLPDIRFWTLMERMRF